MAGPTTATFSPEDVFVSGGGGGGGSVSSWDWGLEVDAATVPVNNFLSGSSSVTIGGISHSFELPLSAVSADMDGANGFVLEPAAGTLPSSGYTNPPRLTFAIADVFPDVDVDKDLLCFQWASETSPDSTWSASFGWIEKAADSLITDMSGFGDGSNSGDKGYVLVNGSGTTTFVEAANRLVTTMIIHPGASSWSAYKQTSWSGTFDEPFSFSPDSSYVANENRTLGSPIAADLYTNGSRMCLAATSHGGGAVSTFYGWRFGRLKATS